MFLFQFRPNFFLRASKYGGPSRFSVWRRKIFLQARVHLVHEPFSSWVSKQRESHVSLQSKFASQLRGQKSTLINLSAIWCIVVWGHETRTYSKCEPVIKGNAKKKKKGAPTRKKPFRYEKKWRSIEIICYYPGILTRISSRYVSYLINPNRNRKYDRLFKAKPGEINLGLGATP